MREQDPGESLAMFLAERTLAGMTEELLAEVQRLLHQAALRVSSAGEAVRYLGCIYMPEDGRCICLFEAVDLAAVRRVNEIAQVPFRRISPAIEFWAPSVGIPEKWARARPERRSPEGDAEA